MQQAYLSNNAMVLTAESTYQSVEKLIPGQTVLNMKLEPIKILMIGECLRAPMIRVNYSNWYESLLCSPSQELLVIDTIGEDDTCELKWIAAEKLTPGMMLMSVEEIYDKLPESFTVLNTPADYNIGLLFGLYAGYGNIADDSKGIEFTFGPNEELTTRVKQLIQQVSPTAETTVQESESVYQLRVSSPELATLFTDFGNKVERRIPRGYWIRNKNYLQGLFEGLIDYNPELKVCRYISVSREMCEAFVWITSQQAINFQHDSVQTHENLRIFPLFVRVDQEESYLNRVVAIEPGVEEKGWYVSVDCPTNSMVVNNTIVKCDDED